MPYSVKYRFSQRFSVSAWKAYKWCTDYSSRDHALMDKENAERQVTYLTENTIIITDIFHTEKGDVEKQKLVHLYPDRLCWVSTHLTGSNKFSQFVYEVSDVGKNVSRLDFTAVHLEYESTQIDRKDVKVLADKLQKADFAAWKLLAKAMIKEAGT